MARQVTAKHTDTPENNNDGLFFKPMLALFPELRGQKGETAYQKRGSCYCRNPRDGSFPSPQLRQITIAIAADHGAPFYFLTTIWTDSVFHILCYSSFDPLFMKVTYSYPI